MHSAGVWRQFLFVVHMGSQLIPPVLTSAEVTWHSTILEMGEPEQIATSNMSFVVYVDMQFDIRVAFSVQIVLFLPPILTSAIGTWR